MAQPLQTLHPKLGLGPFPSFFHLFPDILWEECSTPQPPTHPGSGQIITLNHENTNVQLIFNLLETQFLQL